MFYLHDVLIARFKPSNISIRCIEAQAWCIKNVNWLPAQALDEEEDDPETFGAFGEFVWLLDSEPAEGVTATPLETRGRSWSCPWVSASKPSEISSDAPRYTDASESVCATEGSEPSRNRVTITEHSDTTIGHAELTTEAALLL